MESNIINFLLVCAVSFLAFLVIDMIWLLVIAKSFYREQLGKRWSRTPNIKAAFVFYILFTVGLVYFAIFPGLVEESSKGTALNGALFGFFTYMTYELTNLAVLKNWPKKLVIVDIVWGTFLGLVVSLISYIFLK